MDIWYLETSAINYFMQSHSVEDALSTKHYQLKKGRDWRLSPVAIWEILMTSNEIKREEIIYFCQHLFNRELLPSPEELIIPYIDQGMPLIETPRPLISQTPLARTWRDLVDDRRKTFILDQDDLKRQMKLIQSHSKHVFNIIKKDDFIINSDDEFSGIDVTLNELIDKLPFVKNNERIQRDERLAYKVSLYCILTILCAEAGLDNEVIKQYWKKIGIDSTLERILYVINNLSTLVCRGPFIVMSYMMIAQSNKGFSRGMWFDSLHSVCMTYVDTIFTNDNHFQSLRDIIPEPLLKKKIQHMSEVKITHHETNIFT